jgi:hypothetical protein
MLLTCKRCIRTGVNYLSGLYSGASPYLRRVSRVNLHLISTLIGSLIVFFLFGNFEVLHYSLSSLIPMKPVNNIPGFASDFGFAGYFLFYWRFN